MAESSVGPRKVFTEAQIARYRRIFNMFDINKDGVIESKELAAMAHVMGYQMGKEGVLRIMKKFDMDENGVLTFEEFVQSMPGNYGMVSEQEQWQAELRRKFMEYDKDGNGYISIEEAYEVLSKELAFTPQKTREFIQQFDFNHDGKLSYEEFVGFYIKVKEKKDHIDKAFRTFDYEGKGYVSDSDAKRILGELGFSDPEILSLIRAHDKNNDGKLQYDEFISFWSG